MEIELYLVMAFCIFSFAGAFVLYLLAYLIGWKYMVQEKRCTKSAVGEVVKYTFVNRKGPSSVHLPVVAFVAENKTYYAKGPVYLTYRHYSDLPVDASQPQTIVEDIYSQHFYCRSQRTSFIASNPMRKVFPPGTRLEVFYDPHNPKLSYVMRYCNCKVLFWSLISGAIFCTLVMLPLLAVIIINFFG